MALFNLLITVTHCKKIQHCFNFCCSLIDYGNRHNQFITQSRNIFWNFLEFCIIWSKRFIVFTSGRNLKIIKHLKDKHLKDQAFERFEDYQAFESTIECYQRQKVCSFTRGRGILGWYKKPSRAYFMAEPWIEPAISCSQVRYTTD